MEQWVDQATRRLRLTQQSPTKPIPKTANVVGSGTVVDGGGAANILLMQFQSDILDVPLERCAVAETTALGAAYLAGLGIGFWSNQAQLSSMWRSDRAFSPSMTKENRQALYGRWQRAVRHSRGWARDSD